MGFAVISDHSVNAREANRSSRAKRAGTLFNTTKAIENGVPGIALRGDKMIEWGLSISVSGTSRHFALRCGIWSLTGISDIEQAAAIKLL
jgi:hypothetical protein